MRLHFRLSKEIKVCTLLVMSLVLALLIAAQTAAAADNDAVKPSVDPVRNNDNYTAVVYDNTNGLPTAESNAIATSSLETFNILAISSTLISTPFVFIYSC